MSFSPLSFAAAWLIGAAPGEPDPVNPVDVGSSLMSRIGSMISSTFGHIADHGYHTSVALLVTTIALVVAINQKVRPFVMVPIALGSFWVGWLGWNTITRQDAPLFTSRIKVTRLWDIAAASETGFLVVVIVACVAALLLWRTSISLFSRIAMLVFSILGASFLYNMIEAI